jgi:hypothetical protein
MATMPMSPLSSPRLPSPPPIAEDQSGSMSPVSSNDPEQERPDAQTLDDSGSKRIRPGTKSADMAKGPPLVDISEVKRFIHIPNIF